VKTGALPNRARLARHPRRDIFSSWDEEPGNSAEICLARASQKDHVMPRKRTPSAPFALAIDGGVLLNARAQLDPTLVSRLAQALAVSPDQLFIGTRLPAAEQARTLARLDDAAAEAAARIQGASTRSAAAKSSASDRSRRTRKKM
jgi:hypothetical protein